MRLQRSLLFYVILGSLWYGHCYLVNRHVATLEATKPNERGLPCLSEDDNAGRQRPVAYLWHAHDANPVSDHEYIGDTEIENTLNLPQKLWPKSTNFTKGSLERQIRIQKFWKDNDVYRKLLERRLSTFGEKNFTDTKLARCTRIILDGPPYANGDAHYGHFLNKTIKDVLLKAALLEGRLALFLPGWDCHGIPIESKVLSATDYKLGDIRNGVTESGIRRAVELRQRCSQVAYRSIESQTNTFERAGIWGFWEDFYATYHFYYERKVMEAFRELYNRKMIYRARCPQHYSAVSKSVLADSEIMTEERDILTALVAFQLSDPTPVLDTLEFHRPLIAVKLVCWTTLPWTIPANRGLLINDDVEYDVYYSNGTLYIMNNNENFGVFSPKQHVGKVKGEKLIDSYIRNPVTEAEYQIHDCAALIDKKGTGIVHCAPAHGILDFRILSSQKDFTIRDKFSKEPNTICNIIDEDERFYSGIHVLLDGLSIKDVDGEMLEKTLGEDLLQHRTMRLPVDVDWRYGERTHIRITKQWCLSLSERKACLNELEKVKMYPEASKNYLRNIIKHRSQDWCISRQRIWGTPIPVAFVDGNALENEELSKLCHLDERSEGLMRGEYKVEVDIESLPHYELGDRVFRKLQYQTDTVDVWFESALAQRVTLERLQAIMKELARKAGLPERTSFRNLIAEYAVEGQDQFRGWYQSSLLVNTILGDKSEVFPRRVITHGFVNDDKGKKLSKRNQQTTQNANKDDSNEHNRTDQATSSEDGAHSQNQNGESESYKVTDNEKIVKEPSSSTPILQGADLMTMLGSEYYDDLELIELDKPSCMGADVLRLWVCSNDFLQKDIQLNHANLSEARDFARKVANFFKYTIGVTDDCKLKNDRRKLRVSNFNALDIYFLKRSYELVRDARLYYREGKFHKVVRALEVFLTKFSNIYVSYCKDSLYCDVKHGFQRTAVQIIIRKMMRNVLGVVAPLLPHMMEDVFQTISHKIPNPVKRRDAQVVKSVFGERWRRIPTYLEKVEVEKGVDLALRLRSLVNSMNTKTDNRELVIMCQNEELLREILQLETKYKLDLRLLFNVAEVKLQPAFTNPPENAISRQTSGYKLYLVDGNYSKCRRCWLHRDNLTNDFCERCSNISAKRFSVTGHRDEATLGHPDLSTEMGTEGYTDDAELEQLIHEEPEDLSEHETEDLRYFDDEDGRDQDIPSTGCLGTDTEKESDTRSADEPLDPRLFS